MLELQRWLYVGAPSQLKGFSGVIEPRALLIGTGIAGSFWLRPCANARARQDSAGVLFSR